FSGTGVFSGIEVFSDTETFSGIKVFSDTGAFSDIEVFSDTGAFSDIRAFSGTGIFSDIGGFGCEALSPADTMLPVTGFMSPLRRSRCGYLISYGLFASAIN
ncbi:hypothetical protein, partial [Alistipes putredinis]|uniref:hypothetical protein n=1 Tax=Alistipes putredinis TaxID=28117 RepID=UPI003AF16654